MAWLLYPLALVGSIVVGGVLWLLLSELVRAALQTGRLCAVQHRWADVDITLKMRWRWFLHEIGSCSDYEVGPFELPNNPRSPIRRTSSYRGFPSDKQREQYRKQEEAEARAHWN
ncbi:hypothetical protein [Salipiger sp. PrR003]|uniref:hypothetical protein n=1 Tax=Salipiger sp. PrR003 TaxID=2706776 RepID=UPI0013DAB9A1|nr:hypothetical protein [Salipiger sp. PrR003]NDV50593.1 hypothetical protein [Salipiger sp. PrR003]